MSASDIEIAPLSGSLGAEIHGVDIACAPSDRQIAQIRQALVDHGVVFFRDQDFDAEQHKRFARRFGDIFIHPNFDPDRGDPEVVDLVREPGDSRIVGEEWHSDTTMMPAPPMGAILYGVEIPPYGGDTLFASQQLAYETLPAHLRQAVEGRRAAHSYTARYRDEVFSGVRRPTLTAAQLAEVQAVEHPMVRIHPETGRKGLFVNENFTTHILGIPEDESRQILAELFAHSARPEFIYRHQWQPHDMVFWDNRALIHLATGCPSHQRRHMHRTTIQGSAPL